MVCDDDGGVMYQAVHLTMKRDCRATAMIIVANRAGKKLRGDPVNW